MHTKALTNLILLGGVSLASAAAPPPFARANLVPGALGPLSGSVLFTMSGSGCQVDLEISGFPSTGGPWPYHVHQYAVTGNNCSTAGAPFFMANQSTIPVPCPASQSPGDCRAGDMAGQFGNLTGTTVTASYYDPYISLDPSAPNYVGNLSFNVHWANFTVIACCNIEMYAPEVTTSSSASVVTSTAMSTATSAASTTPAATTTAATTSSAPVFTSEASVKAFGTFLSAAAFGLVALML